MMLSQSKWFHKEHILSPSVSYENVQRTGASVSQLEGLNLMVDQMCDTEIDIVVCEMLPKHYTVYR